MAKDLQIIKSEGGLTIKWDGTHQWKGDQYDDLVMIALYHPENHDASLFLNAGKRDQGECFVAIADENLLNGSIEAYICFKSADGSSISDSAYLGNVNGSYQEKIEVEVDEQYTELLAEVEKAKAVFLKQDAYFSETGLKRKTLKDVKKQYEVLKERLDNLPGKPV